MYKINKNKQIIDNEEHQENHRTLKNIENEESQENHRK